MPAGLSEIAILLAVDAALLGAIVLLREPKLLVPAVVIGLPFEYLETQTLGALGHSGVAGAVRSLLNPGQAAMAATVLVGAFRVRHDARRLIPGSALILPLATLFALEFLGVAWSDSLAPPNSVLILPLYGGFVLVAPSLIEDRRDLERIAGAFLLIAIGLGMLAITQRLFGVFNWRSILVQSDAYSYRANATFADPNNLARFLALAMSLAGGLILATGARRLTLYLAAPVLAVGSVAIVATASRSGWLMLILSAFLVVLTAPIARYTKARITIGAFLALSSFLLFVLAQGGTDAERVRSLTSGVSAIGQRTFLIRAGWEMFKDNPLAGVGSGNYQHALTVSYLHLFPWWARTTLSHTSLVSVMAEMGIIGMAMFTLLAARVAATVTVTYFRTAAPYTRLITGWLGASFIGIVMHSQSEGRLLDEPFLWLLLAMLIAIETGPAFARSLPAAAPMASDTAPPAPAASEAAAAGAA